MTYLFDLNDIINLYILKESFFFGYSSYVLDFLYITSIISALLILICKNPILSVLFLVSLFLNVSAYLILLGINFIGISYLLIYVGAISILFLFILMLINIRSSELVNNTTNSIYSAIIISLLFIYCLNENTFFNETVFNSNYYTFIFSDYEKEKIMFVTSKYWDSNLAANSHIYSIGNISYINYFILLIIASLILLLALIGIISIIID